MAGQPQQRLHLRVARPCRPAPLSRPGKWLGKCWAPAPCRRWGINALSRLGGELADVDARLETEGLRLAREWHQLKVAINLGHLQHERARASTAVSLAASREACAHAQEEARATDCRCEVAERREQELHTSNAVLERQIQARRAALVALPSEAPSDEEVQEREEALALEVLEHSLALEQLEVREHQAAAAEDAVTAREARIQQEAELEGRTSALRTKLDAAEQRERDAKEAQASAQADLAFARADLSSLQQLVEVVTSLAEKTESEDNQAGWVDDLLVEFALEDNVVVIAAEGGGAGDDDEDDARDNAGGADDDDDDNAGGSVHG
nr:uncharacterized protein CG45076-like [Aegilops tauschii subsp. strangulata]